MKKDMVLRLSVFLLINFGALAVGGLFTSKGVSSDWYMQLNKAPWTPPGWMFGVAWTSIMICFSVYMSYLYPTAENKSNLLVLFIFQWVLNVMWNPVFFYYQRSTSAFIIIILLTLLVGYFLFNYWNQLKLKSILILPYFIWLLIATSLNGYIFIKN